MDFFNPAFWTFISVIAGIYAIMALGLYVQLSLAGLPNFGHVAFMAVAAYTMAILVARYEVSLPLASVAAILAAILLGLVLGIPTLRLRADYVAIATVAGGEIVRYLAMNLADFTGGPMGSIGINGPGQIALYNRGWQALLDDLAHRTAAVLGIAPSRDQVMALLVWLLAALLLLAFWRLERSPWGRVLKAIREDETAVAVLLEVDRVGKSFGGVAAVRDASFGIAEGSITALIGPNGAGKTTMFNLVSGFLHPDRGIIGLAGQRVERRRPDVIARAGLVRAFQSARVLTRMSVLENMMLGAKHQPGETLGMAWLRPYRVLAREREVRPGQASPRPEYPNRVLAREREVRRRALELLELIRLAPLRDAYAGTLSGGQRKLLELGRALMVEPRMILLDEPMAGISPVLALQLLEHIRELSAKDGVTVCVIEHDMDVVMSISDRVIVMDEGTVIAEGSPAAIQRNPIVIEAYLGRLGQAAPGRAGGAA